RPAAVEQGGDLAVGVHADETAGELVAVRDLDGPGVVFGGVTGLEQFLEHDAGLHPVGRGERVELERMLADRQIALLARTGGRAIDAGELPAVLGISPDFGRDVARIGHRGLPVCAASTRNGSGRAEPQAGSAVPCPMATRAPKLIYVDDELPGITRKRAGKGWAYYDVHGKLIRDPAERKRLNAVALPPAYTDAWFCPAPNGHILATGTDAKGRKQYRYHPDFRTAREGEKFDGCLVFGNLLPLVRKRVEEDLSGRTLTREHAIASVVRLLDLGAMRIG